MKRVIAIVIALAFVAFVAFKLWDNKQRIEDATSLAEAQVSKIPVTVQQIAPWTQTFYDALPGKLAAEAELMLTSSTQGRIANVFVTKGQWVDKGTPIARVEDDLYREEYEVTSAAYEKLKKDKERFRIMAENDAITGQQREALEMNLRSAEAKFMAAKKQLNEATIKSPIAGYINQLFVKPGGLVGAGIPVCEIVNTTNLVLRLKVSPDELLLVRQADVIGVTTYSAPSDTIQGTLSFQSLKPDYTGQYDVEITFTSSPESVSAGMSGTAIFETHGNSDRVIIPESALLGYGGDEFYVFCAAGDVAKKVVVRPGRSHGEWIEIESGLKVGDNLIVTGQTMLEEGQQINIIP